MTAEEISDLLCVGFNQDAKSLSVGHQNGYILYNNLGNCIDGSQLEYDSDNTPVVQDAWIVERLFTSSLVVVVSQKNPRAMHVYHSQTRNMICDHKFPNSILAVKLTRERVVACLEECIYIYNLKDMKQMHTICDTPQNKLGLIDLSANGSSLLAYPGSAVNGSVHIFDAMNLSSVNTFAAHAAPLAALKFNSDGTKIATASSKGTVIRVFSVPQGTKLFEFSRGMTRCVTISSLAFSADSTLLCSSSNTETVHVYKLVKPEEQPQSGAEPVAADGGWLGYFSQTASALLPGQMNDLLLREKSFATARLPACGSRNVAALPTINGQPHLVVATTDGFLYCYRIERDGGECELLRQHRIGPQGGGGGASRGGAKQVTASPGGPPNPDDPDDFPPMSHTSG